jgi:hypothetical protein
MKKIIITAMIAIGAIGLFIGIRCLLHWYMGPPVTGVIKSENPDVGIWTITPDMAKSGLRQEGFLGVDIWDTKNPSVRIRAIKDPVAGDTVIIKSMKTTEAGKKFTGADCNKLSLSVSRIQVFRVKGALSMDGGGITAELKFDCD